MLLFLLWFLKDDYFYKRYDFNLRTGISETGLKACTYHVDVRGDSVWVETPEDGVGWELVELRPVSEGKRATRTGVFSSNGGSVKKDNVIFFFERFRRSSANAHS